MKPSSIRSGNGTSRSSGQNIFAAFIAIVCVGLLPHIAFGQSWACGGGVCTTTGDVGIGLTNPQGQLDIAQSGFGPGLLVRNGTNPYIETTDGTIITKLQTVTGWAGL